MRIFASKLASALAVALLATLAHAESDIDKALREIDAEQARIFKQEFDEAKRKCDDEHSCIAYKIMLEDAKRRLQQERARGAK